MRDFIDILRTHNLYSESLHNRSSHEYQLFGNLVEFISMDSFEKVKGRKRNLLFVNEASQIAWPSMQQLLFRTNGVEGYPSVIVDYNPSDSYSWVYDKLLSRNDCELNITTYKDNKFLEPDLIEEIERLKDTDEEMWQIYGMGVRGISRATIFRYHEFDTIPDDAEYIGVGLDYGYVNDQTAACKIYKRDQELYIEEILYQLGMNTNDIIQFLKSKGLENDLIVADSAEPRLNDEIRKRGIRNLQKSIKGRDSINAGIDMMRRFKLFAKGDNLIHEFRNYKWSETRDGKLTNKPIDKFNHLCDSARYLIYNTQSRPNFGKYAVH